MTSMNLDDVRTHVGGRLQFIVGLCERIGLPRIFNKHLEKVTGRPKDIPPGTEAMMLLAPMADEGYKPLYELNEYYADREMEGIFHYPVDLEQVNDSRFGYFLDDFYKAGCREIFSEICTNALLTFGIKVNNINFDTTSFVMWGEYETIAGKTGAISIDFGHSKARRPDKKQIKMAIGTANGTIVDAKVLSGNADDKTYNKDNIDDASKLLDQLNIDRGSFYYIADSALFSEENIRKMNEAKIKFITRIPDNVNVAKELINEGVKPSNQNKVIYINAHNKEVVYYVRQSQGEYEGHALNFAVVLSEALIPAKTKSCTKKVEAEAKKLSSEATKLMKQKYSCEEEVLQKIQEVEAQYFAKINFHTVKVVPVVTEKRKPGRQFLDAQKNTTIKQYNVALEFERDENKIQEYIREESTFVLTSNDLEISGENTILEYKTQYGCEKKFQQIKSHHFVNALFLDKPERIEALAYILLMTIMVLSIAETVVRSGLAEENETVKVTGKFKRENPTMLMILRIFRNVVYQTYLIDGKAVRRLFKPLTGDQEKIIRYLGIPESVFAWNPT